LNFVDFCHDSAKQASLMALAAPKIHSSFFTLHSSFIRQGPSIFCQGPGIAQEGPGIFKKSAPA
jgi:hypothetical protein